MYKKLTFLLCALSLSALHAELSEYENALLKNIPASTHALLYRSPILAQLPADAGTEQILTCGAGENILFTYFPHLKTGLSYIGLCDLPTPIYKAQLNEQFPDTKIYIKHDGLTGYVNNDGTRAFGGNKLRKLSYLLADALAHGHNTVMTFGCVASNHALQTALCAKKLHLSCICMLKHQPNSYTVRKNLLLQQTSGSQLQYAHNNEQRAQEALSLCIANKLEHGRLPYIIPTGGSNPRGAIGYVQAAFELKEQIMQGIMPEPDYIYVTFGSGGTAAGLLLGLQAAGIKSKLLIAAAEPVEIEETQQLITQLFTDTNALLRSLDDSFPLCTLTDDAYTIRTEHAGTQYGMFTLEGNEAGDLFRETEHLALDGVYTAKCVSTLLSDLKENKLKGKTILYWHTLSQEVFLEHEISYTALPEPFHRYFEEPAQPLDEKK